MEELDQLDLWKALVDSGMELIKGEKENSKNFGTWQYLDRWFQVFVTSNHWLFFCDLHNFGMEVKITN